MKTNRLFYLLLCFSIIAMITTGCKPEEDQTGNTAEGLSIVDIDGRKMSEIDFGEKESETTRIFYLYNGGNENINWEIVSTSAWVNARDSVGTLETKKNKAVPITINRDLLEKGLNTTTLVVMSNNGNAEIDIRATNNRENIVVSTLEVTNIEATSATFNGKIVESGNPKYIERGFVYCTSTQPTSEISIDKTQPTLEISIDKLTAPVNDVAIYDCNVNKLEENTTYYVRGFARNELGIVYSDNVMKFTTKQNTDSTSECPTQKRD